LDVVALNRFHEYAVVLLDSRTSRTRSAGARLRRVTRDGTDEQHGTKETEQRKPG
jgi:hypothetical protein